MTKICYVSLFLDLEREKWKNFNRTFSIYMKHFYPFISMFSKPNGYKDEDETFEYEMVLFLDKKRVEEVKKEFKPETNIKIIEIDREYLQANFPMWKTLPKEKEIMESKEYKELLSNRITYPEHNNPEYTLINHCKIDAIVDAIVKGYSNADYYAWVDFGYFSLPKNIPKNMLDIYKLNLNTINYTLINSPTEKDKDPIYTITKAPECIGGFFFFGSKDNMLKYQKQYHLTLDYFQNNLRLADDDQHLALVSYFINPEMFTLHHLGKWHIALLQFQKDPAYNAKYDLLSYYSLNNFLHIPETNLCKIMNKHGSDKGSGYHNYTKLYHCLFTNIRERPLNILEIGIRGINKSIPGNMGGDDPNYIPGSIRGWREYFCNSTIYACDIDDTIINFQKDRIVGFYLDQKNTKCIIEQFYKRFKDIQFDIIIDDGLQHFKTNWNVLKLLYPKLKKNGIYIIEDIVDYELKIMGKPNFACSYIQLPNPKNNTDNNILLALKN